VASIKGVTGEFVGRTGTLFQCQSSYPDTYSTGYDGVKVESDFGVTSNDLRIARDVSLWHGPPTVVEWTDDSTYVSDVAVQRDNTVDYMLSGLTPVKAHDVYLNGTLIVSESFESSAGGTLEITNITLTAPTTIRVEEYLPKGSMFMLR